MVSEHRATGGAAARTWLGAGPLLGIGVGLIAANVVAVQRAQFHPSWVGTWPFAAAAIVAGMFFFERWWRARHSALDLRRRGLVYRDGRQPWRLRWRDIESVRYASVARGPFHPGVEHHLKLETCEGQTLTIHPWLGDLAAASERIHHEVCRRALRHARRALRADRPVLFGRLSLSPEALWVDTRKIPWSRVGRAAWSEGNLIIVDRSGVRVATLAGHELPNVPALLTLIGELAPAEALPADVAEMVEQLFSQAFSRPVEAAPSSS